jgi:hypothetical protein
MSTNFDDWTQEIDAGTMGGRQLPSFVGGKRGVLATIRSLQPASDDRVALARRNLREINDVDLERTAARRFRHRETGEEWLIPHGFVDLVDPAAASAFCIRDELIVPLQKIGEEPQGETQGVGQMSARRA